MIDVESIPKNGQILIVAYFKEWSTHMQNSSRLLLKERIPAIGKKVLLDLKPLLFGILRHNEFGKSRPVGVLYSFSYKNMTSTRYREFHQTLKDRFGQSDQVKNMWGGHYDVLVASGIGGL